MLNKVMLMGRLTRDPEFRQTTSGVAMCRFTVAIDRRFSNKETGERQADFISCTAWRQQAEFISRYFTKGRMILVEGSLRNNDYTDNNGVKHYSMDVQVDNVSFCGDGKNASGNGGGFAQQGGFAAPQQSNNGGYGQQQYAAPAQPKESLQIGDLGEFEEILSDGEVPF